MEEQLSASFPIHTYPQVTLLPDGGVAVSAGKLLVRYAQSEPGVFTKAFSYPDRPGPPWSYPQTGGCAGGQGRGSGCAAAVPAPSSRRAGALHAATAALVACCPLPARC